MKYHDKNTFRPFTSWAVLCIFVACFLLFPSAGNGGLDGKGYFRQGRQDLEALRYSDAVRNLSIAQREFPLLGDYTLYYLAEAYHGLGEYRKSLEATQSLLKNYPATPLRKKARLAEIRETKESCSRDVPLLYEAYSKEYPEDEDALFLYGKILKEAGNAAKASAVFKKIYIEAGEFSNSALSELRAEDIKADDIIERASNLFKRYNFAEAERDLRQALLKDDGAFRTEILKNLGHSLFRQKNFFQQDDLHAAVRGREAVGQGIKDLG